MHHNCIDDIFLSSAIRVRKVDSADTIRGSHVPSVDVAETKVSSLLGWQDIKT